jgi:uncharacterized protein YjbJ (UPF0337 family)
MAVNANTIEGNWLQVKGKIRESWGKLTDDDIEEISGKRDVLLGKIQERYGIAQDEADKKLSDFEKKIS